MMSKSSKKSLGKPAGIFQWFFHSQVSGSMVLLVCTVAALVWANSPWSKSYFDLAGTYIGVSWAGSAFKLSLQHWVNDFLMVIFFFVVGLEIKREIVIGQLSSMRKAILPVSAAVGGMLVPATFYVFCNMGGDGAHGWGIPMATDIAFALGIMALFGTRAPIGLKVFLTALAIADDIGAVLVIALFYTEKVRLAPLVVAGVFLFLILVAVKLRIRRPGLFFLLAVGTVAGILVAMMVPVKPRSEPAEMIRRARARISELESGEPTRESVLLERDQLHAVEELHMMSGRLRPPGITLERYWHPTQAFLILPLFAFFNAGVVLDAEAMRMPPDRITIGIILGLFLGKQIGVTLFSWLAIRTGLADMPEGVTWAQIWGASCLAGVGFTMSLFVSELAFNDPAMISEAKIGILAGSLISGVVGYVVLWRALRGSGR